MDKKRLKNDLILATVLLCTALLAWGLIRLTRVRGAYAVVTVDGQEQARFSLGEDIEYEILTEGGHVNRIVISGGKASVTEADCPDKLCVKQPEIGMKGQTIVCLPHKVVIRIEGGREADTP